MDVKPDERVKAIARSEIAAEVRLREAAEQKARLQSEAVEAIASKLSDKKAEADSLRAELDNQKRMTATTESALKAEKNARALLETQVSELKSLLESERQARATAEGAAMSSRREESAIKLSMNELKAEISRLKNTPAKKHPGFELSVTGWTANGSIQSISMTPKE